MKAYLLLLILLIGGSAGAQKRTDSIYNELRARIQQCYPQGMPNAFRPRSLPFVLQAPGTSLDSLRQMGSALTLRHKGTGVRVLPQDGMPCVIPDLGGVVAIPNAFPNPSATFRNAMPNPYPVPGSDAK